MHHCPEARSPRQIHLGSDQEYIKTDTFVAACYFPLETPQFAKELKEEGHTSP